MIGGWMGGGKDPYIIWVVNCYELYDTVLVCYTYEKSY